VHVRAAAGDFPQTRCVEGVPHLDDTGHELAATDITWQADVLKAVIGEVPALMARRALGLGIEERKAALGFPRRWPARFRRSSHRRARAARRPVRSVFMARNNSPMT